MKIKRVSGAFFRQSTADVARGLLGKILIRVYRGRILAGRITEVERYGGAHDQASHAWRGRTQRTEPMFGPPGSAYVYLIYGMYHCLNIVTEQQDVPAAVLIRSVEPLQGVSGLTTGPGRLTRAFHITRQLNTEDITTSTRLYIADDGVRLVPRDIASRPRIGVGYARKAALLPWRLHIKDSPFVSKP